MPDIICDDCDQPFTPKLFERKEKDGVTQLFVCPHCERPYMVAHITTMGLMLRNRLRKLRRKGEGHTDKFAETKALYEGQLTDLTAANPGAVRVR